MRRRAPPPPSPNYEGIPNYRGDDELLLSVQFLRARVCFFPPVAILFTLINIRAALPHLTQKLANQEGVISEGHVVSVRFCNHGVM